MATVTCGYDAHIVFPGTDIHGFTASGGLCDIVAMLLNR